MFCEWEENECTSNPCQNGGQCVASTVDTYFCACVNGFSGTNCELDLDGCNFLFSLTLYLFWKLKNFPFVGGSSPCQNNGTCVNEENGLYKCQCGPGFAGDQCQIGRKKSLETNVITTSMLSNFRTPLGLCDDFWGF